MKALLVSFVALGALTSSAMAQGWDRDRDWRSDRDWRYEHRHENPGERILRGAVRGLTGDYGPRCHVVVTRRRNWDGDIVINRRRICD